MGGGGSGTKEWEDCGCLSNKVIFYSLMPRLFCNVFIFLFKL